MSDDLELPIVRAARIEIVTREEYDRLRAELAVLPRRLQEENDRLSAENEELRSEHVFARLESEIARLRAELAEAEREIASKSEQIGKLYRVCNEKADLSVRLERAETDLAAAREVIEIIAGKRQCVDNLMSNAEIARAFLERTATDATLAPRPPEGKGE
jgi:chromosome segregation ATPase